MRFWKRLLGGGDGASPEPTGDAEHAVLIHIKLAAQMPSDEELSRYFGIQDELREAIASADAGELDGDEWGGGECVVFMYGPDAQRLWDAIEPVVQRHPFPRGSFAIKRSGGPDCGHAERVSIEWEG